MPATVASVNDVGPLLLVVGIVLTLLAIATTILRLWARIQRRVPGWDDYTIVLATTLGIARTIVQIVSVSRGNGKHQWNLPEEDYIYISFCGWLTALFLYPMLALLKISICLLVLRIKDVKKLRYFVWAVTIGLVLTNLLPFVILLAECDPVSASWKAQTEKCWRPDARLYSLYLQTAYSVLTDLLCSLLPIYVVWDLRISLHKKLGVCGLMSLGLISTAFAILRASSFGGKPVDFSWTYAWTGVWADIEVNVGIIAANLSLSRMYFVCLKNISRSMLGYGHSSSSRIDTSSPCEMMTYTGPHTVRSVDVRGPIRRKESPAPSDDSKLPIQYSIYKGHKEIALDHLKSGPDMHASHDSVQQPVRVYER
ncbi:hypothetical protein LTR37_016365 [Vermiconidia calcicola]|uniref:Uncharacterized protein n=1 Tax=Vermiconidia calcicola TaxID=1690605 RepID=A0ACC3MPL4_9PEZI|nr:hypothetical protein LTR37_016365 [Vermiconidia calcicola]